MTSGKQSPIKDFRPSGPDRASEAAEDDPADHHWPGGPAHDLSSSGYLSKAARLSSAGEGLGLMIKNCDGRPLPRLVSAFDEVRSGRARPTSEGGKSTYRVGEISFVLRAAP